MPHLPEDIPETQEIQNPDLGAQSVAADGARQESLPDTFIDTFFGPNDKNYLDLLNRRMNKLRGTHAYYYTLTSQTERTDDIEPVSIRRDLDPLDNQPANKRHAGGLKGKMIAAMYGETVTVGERKSAVEREVTPTWDFAEPILVRGVLYDPERAESPDARGSIYTQRIRYSIPRTLCDKTWFIRPRVGDMVRIPTVTNPPDRPQDDYYDVEEVVINDTRFGSTGFFTAYTLQLSRSSRHAPQRKIAEKDKRPPPIPPV
jgi:hypothetical protein